MRTIVIGDVHGCIDELKELLRVVEATPQDELICVGDLICKGPDSHAVMKWAMETPNVHCVLGNHEARLLRCWREGVIPNIKPYDFETYKQFGKDFDACMRFVDSWPLQLSGKDFLVVHAGIDPRVPLVEQRPDDLVNLRFLKELNSPWYETYRDERTIVFGHWARKEPLVRANVFGIDTGCVYGGALTALILPERRLVSVSARRTYQIKTEWNYEN